MYLLYEQNFITLFKIKGCLFRKSSKETNIEKDTYENNFSLVEITDINRILILKTIPC